MTVETRNKIGNGRERKKRGGGGKRRDGREGGGGEEQGRTCVAEAPLLSQSTKSEISKFLWFFPNSVNFESVFSGNSCKGAVRNARWVWIGVLGAGNGEERDGGVLSKERSPRKALWGRKGGKDKPETGPEGAGGEGNDGRESEPVCKQSLEAVD
jgi:hypothetical protein